MTNKIQTIWNNARNKNFIRNGMLYILTTTDLQLPNWMACKRSVMNTPCFHLQTINLFILFFRIFFTNILWTLSAARETRQSVAYNKSPIQLGTSRTILSDRIFVLRESRKWILFPEFYFSSSTYPIEMIDAQYIH